MTVQRLTGPECGRERRPSCSYTGFAQNRPGYRMGGMPVPLDSVEHLRRVHGQPKLVAESTRARVAGVRGPLHAAASLLPGRLEYHLHQQSPDAATAMALRDVKLLEVERPGQAHCRPQGRTRTRSPQPLPVSDPSLDGCTWPQARRRRSSHCRTPADARHCSARSPGIICRMACSGWCTAGPRPARRSPGVPKCRGARPTGGPSWSAGATISWPGWWPPSAGWPRMTGPAGHNGRTRVLRRYADDHRRDPVAVGDGRTGVPHPEDPRSPGTATPPRRRAGESLNLLSRDRTSDGHASIYCGNASCGRERAQIMVLL